MKATARWRVIAMALVACSATLVPVATAGSSPGGEQTPVPDAEGAFLDEAFERGSHDLTREHLDAQKRNWDTARQLEQVFAGEEPRSEASKQSVRVASVHQAQTLGASWEPPTQTSEHERPSAALATLAERHGTELSPAEANAVSALEETSPTVAQALTDVGDAFLALERATERALEADAFDPSSVFPARSALFAASMDLRQAVQETDPGSGIASSTAQQAPTSIVVPPALALDLAGQDNTYTEDVALAVDLGGDDTYDNNAGGGGTGGGSPLVVVAALIDLGAGADEYGGNLDVVNGGGFGGTGFLLDGGGNDVYEGGSVSNGGGEGAGLGFLADLGGDDTYYGGSASNGGAAFGPAAGFLLDGDGRDSYAGGSWGVNGGAEASAVIPGSFLDVSAATSGMLVDRGADADTYTADQDGTNGGGSFLGAPLGDGAYPAGLAAGFLFDDGGDDAYDAESTGSNGGAAGSVGFLLDRGGDDTYDVAYKNDPSVNGGGDAGFGALVDGGGSDEWNEWNNDWSSDWSCDNSFTDDCSRVPKGTVGVLVDWENPP